MKVLACLLWIHVEGFDSRPPKNHTGRIYYPVFLVLLSHSDYFLYASRVWDSLEVFFSR
jgi:hypothetical protein